MADKSYKAQIDREKVRQVAERTMGFLGGAVISGMIYLGDKMGLYQTLDGAGPGDERRPGPENRSARALATRMARRPGGRRLA